MLLVVGFAGGAAADSTACTPDWAVIPSPNVGQGSILQSMKAFADDDVWAIGTGNTNALSVPLAAHWNGSSWSLVPSPPVGTLDEMLGTDGDAPDDVWAVGWASLVNHDHALVERWDGSTWSRVRSPGLNAQLNGVAALSPTDVWAVGLRGSRAGVHPYVIQWTGTSWTVFRRRNRGASDYSLFNGIDAASSDDIWAVGFKMTPDHSAQSGLVEHWDGSHWTIVPSAHTRFGETLSSVNVVGPSNVWVVGWKSTRGGSARAFAEHWDGSAWSTVSIPDPGPGLTLLQSVAFDGPGDGWAVGYSSFMPLVEHWDGTSWSIVPSVPTGASLFGLALTPSTVWAVGGTSARTTFTIERCR